MITRQWLVKTETRDYLETLNSSHIFNTIAISERIAIDLSILSYHVWFEDHILKHRYFYLERGASVPKRWIPVEAHKAYLYKKNNQYRDVLKTRTHFVSMGRAFRLDRYTMPFEMVILETKTYTPKGKIELPSFIPVIKEVTNVAEYGIYHIARIPT